MTKSLFVAPAAKMRNRKYRPAGTRGRQWNSEGMLDSESSSTAEVGAGFGWERFDVTSDKSSPAVFDRAESFTYGDPGRKY